MKGQEYRNSIPDKLKKRQYTVTMDLISKHQKMTSDINVAKNKLEDLENRQKNLLIQIKDILADKRLAQEKAEDLENRLHQKNQTEDV